MSNINYENEYITNILKINKTLRDQIELLYSLLKKKNKIDYSSKYTSKIETILNEMEILQSNLSLLMKNQNSLIDTIKNADKKVIKEDEYNNKISELQKLNDNINKENTNIKLEIDIIKKDNENLKNTLNTIKIENENLLEKQKEVKTELIKALSENKTLIEKMKEDKDNENISETLMNKIDLLTKKLQAMEINYENKIQQKDLIIAKLDEQLQSYEITINQFKNEQISNKNSIDKYVSYSNNIQNNELNELNDINSNEDNYSI